MARHRVPVVPLAILAAVMLAGAGADAFNPHRATSGADDPPPAADGAQTGVSASPGPSRDGSATPQATQPAGPAVSTTPARVVPAASTPVKAASRCAQGERQREVEEYLAQLGGFGPVTLDGIQSDADCLAIKKFQQRYGIRPAEGRAGPTTADVARRLAASRIADCQAGTGTTICVNLTLQTVWAVKGGQVVLPPTVTRTGMRGYATPSGTYSINRTSPREWSVPYRVWLPYWQQFLGGMGFHETTTYLHNASIGSHGCVNLLHADAVALWGLAGVGARVHLFGRRPGT